jgi:hypothetical protein
LPAYAVRCRTAKAGRADDEADAGGHRVRPS